MFTDLEQEYRFSTKDLTESYLLRKLNMWLAAPVKGDKLVKEIAFASFKYPGLFRNLMLANQGLLADINLGSVTVITRCYFNNVGACCCTLWQVDVFVHVPIADGGQVSKNGLSN